MCIDKVVVVGRAGPAVFECRRGGDSRSPTVAPFLALHMPVVVQRQVPYGR